MKIKYSILALLLLPAVDCQAKTMVSLLGNLGTPPAITLTPAPSSWSPTCTEGDAASTQNIVMTANNGSVTLGAGAAALATGTVFSITADTCSSATVTAGNTCTVSLAMDCTTAGTPTDTLTITSDATDSPKAVTLSGTVSSAPTPDSFYVLDTAGGSGSQIYDSVSAAWEGGGADTVSFASGYLVSDSATDLCYAPGTSIDYSTQYTIYFEYQVSAADNTLYTIYYSSGGDALSFQHQSAAGIGKFIFRPNYGTSTFVSWTNTGYALDTWHTVYIPVDITNKTYTVYYNGSEVTGKTESGFVDIADQVTLAGNLYLGYDTTPTGAVSIRNYKVFPGLVTP